MRKVLVPLALVLFLVAAVAAVHGGDSSRPDPRAPERAVTIAAADPAADPVDLAAAEQTVVYLQAIQAQQVGEYLHAVAVADVAAFLASIPPPPPPAPPAAAAPAAPMPASPGYSTGGGCASGGGGNYAVPAWIVARESGGDYCAANPSGACGAYQIMPGTWAGFGGYASACDAPPAVQDEKARSMAACNWEPPNYCAG